MNDLPKILSNFNIDEEVTTISPFGSGHINDTYKVGTKRKNYLLQRINHHIFKNVKGLTNNIVLVTAHLQNKTGSTGSDLQVPELYKTKMDEYLHIDDQSNYWRLFGFVENSKSFDLVENPQIAYEGGKAYGNFVKLLADFPVKDLVETIPGFHDAKNRIDYFKTAIKNNKAERAGEIKELLNALTDRSESMMLIYNMANEGKIPLRVTHNDTKINNVLFNSNNIGISVIDLDTVMPGYVHFDFGDAIRTFTNTGSEDEKDLDKISMNIELFKGFSEGFLSLTKDLLSKEEIQTLAFSAKYIVYEQTIRFLADYLDGDAYYKIKYPNHNLVRAKAQFKLLESMEEQFEEMKKIVISVINK